jgi:hypothetical protein
MSLINTLMGVGEIEITDIGFKGQAQFHFLPSSAMAASGGPKKPSLAATLCHLNFHPLLFLPHTPIYRKDG